MMRSRTKKTAALSVVIAATLAAAGCGVSLQSLPKPGVDRADTYPVHATFDDVLNLPVDGQVRDGSRIVGVVGSLDVDGYDADVVLRIKNTYKIPAGTTAEVRFDNPLGDQYIELHRPDGEAASYLASGDRLALSETSAAPTVEDTLGAFATVINGGGVGNLQSIAHELNLMFDGNQPQIRSLLGKLDTAATELAGGIGHVDEALDALDGLTTQLNDSGETLPKGLKSLSDAIGVLAGQDQQFTDLISAMASFGKVGNEVIDKSGRDTVDAIKALAPVVEQIVEADAKITPALQNLSALEAQIPKVTEGGYVNASARISVRVNSAPSGIGAPAPFAPASLSSLLSPAGAAAPPSTVKSLMTVVGFLEATPNAGGAR